MTEDLLQKPKRGPISRAYKVRMLPTKEQEELLRRVVNATRGARNFAIGELQAAYETAQILGEEPERMSLWDLHREGIMPDWAKSSIPATVLNCESQKHQKAIKNFFDSVSGRRKGPRMGLPQPKSRFGRQSFSFQGTIADVTDETVVLPTSSLWTKAERELWRSGIKIAEPIARRIRAGALRLTGTKKDGTDSGKPRQFVCTVSCEGGWWYFSLGIAEHHPPAPRRPPTERLVGIDARCAAYVCSDGYRYELPPRLVELERRIEEASRDLSRKVLGSNNRAKARDRLSKLHARSARIRKDWIEKITTEIVIRCAVIALEDLDIKKLTAHEGPRKSRLNRSILRSSFGMFRIRIEQKATWYERRVIIIDPAYTSQECSKCGTINSMRLTDRTYVCKGCNFIADRYYNAAVNIKHRAEKILGALALGSSGATANP